MIKVLRNFHYGSISDPKSMIAGNIQEIPDDASEHDVREWIRLGWIRVEMEDDN